MTRVMMYSLDFHGFGHFSRNYKIAQFVRKHNKRITFTLLSNKFPPMCKEQDGINFVRLPEIKSKLDPKRTRYAKTLPLELNKLVEKILAELDSKKYDIFYSDLSPNGGYGELRSLFKKIKNYSLTTMLGIRDILDSKKLTKLEWYNSNPEVLGMENYDKILVYGHKDKFIEEYGDLIQIQSKYHFLGYLLPPISKSKLPRTIDIFAMFGGGGKSFEQIDMLAKCLKGEINLKIIFLVGPFVPKDKLIYLRRTYSMIRFIHSSKTVLNYLSRSKLVIAHAGYNSLMEALTHTEYFLQIPRNAKKVDDRMEQVLRARYFSKLDVCDYIDLTKPNKEILRKIKSPKKTNVKNLGKTAYNQKLINMFG